MRKGGWIPANHWGRLFLRGASADTKLVACYLMTCAHASAGGVVRGDATLMASDLGMAHGALVDALEALVRRRFVVPYLFKDALHDEGGRSLSACFAWAVPAILEAEPIANANQGKAVAKDLRDLLDDGSEAFWSALFASYQHNGAKHLPADFLGAIERRLRPSTLEVLEGEPIVSIDAAAHGGEATITATIDNGQLVDVEVTRPRSWVAGTLDAMAAAVSPPVPDASMPTVIGDAGGMLNTMTGPVEDDAAIAEALSDAEPELEPPPAVHLFNAWNVLAKVHGLALVQEVDGFDIEAAAARVAQLGGVDKIPLLMGKVDASPFLLGKVAHPATGEFYQLTFEALCRESLFTMIMDGKYDPPPAPKPGPPAPEGEPIPDFLRRK